ncbi:MAG: tRNA pseudouridine synthase A [Phycisphaerales bacterium]|jgi:tRNA pseudouridine38-40 synthase|nr:tRNA pseudouridine(38-40) synthase TruA [Phycisphaeraceae bacterium]
MPRYKLTIAYDGTDFVGWQKQEPLDAQNAIVPGVTAYTSQTPMIESTRPGRVALRSVQGVVERAVSETVREPVELVGASRTDSGVHARGQVAAFTCGPYEGVMAEERAARPGVLPGAGWPVERGADRLLLAINSRLPDDIVVLACEVVHPEFDPIGDVISKGYSYAFHVSRSRPLWDRRFVHHIWHPRGLDVGAMDRAAQALVGEHDFAAFAAAGHGRLSTVRTIHELRVRAVEPLAGTGSSGGFTRAEGAAVVGGLAAGGLAGGGDGAQAERIVLSISGSGFLWNMVRIIAGTLMQVGLGQRSVEDVAATLASRERARAGPTLRPEGLCLEWIRYRSAHQ